MSETLRWPKVMPSWAYRDPATIGDTLPISGIVPRETSPALHAPAPRDRHYTQARRLHIRNLMRSR